jgi:hypothetical protein
MDDKPADPPQFTEPELTARLIELRQQHVDLSAAIEALIGTPAPDLLVIARMKKQKLALKDAISRLEDLATPDIIA